MTQSLHSKGLPARPGNLSQDMDNLGLPSLSDLLATCYGSLLCNSILNAAQEILLFRLGQKLCFIEQFEMDPNTTQKHFCVPE